MSQEEGILKEVGEFAFSYLIKFNVRLFQCFSSQLTVMFKSNSLRTWI